MAYTAGDIITASDLNGFISVIDNVWGVGYSTRGYGQPNPLPLVTTGTIINGNSWANMLPRITTLGLHQLNVTHPGIPLASAFNTGKLIETLNDGTPNTDLPSAVSAIDTHRLTAHVNSVSSFSGITGTRNTSWGTSASPRIIHEVAVDFTSANAARYFFNSGGVISFTCSRSGGSSTPQNTNWGTLLQGLGTVRFNYLSTIVSGTGSGTGIGYYGLTGNYLRIANASASGYGVHDFAIYAKTDAPGSINGSNGGVVTFKIEFNNGYPSGGDVVNGTLTTNLSFTKATTYLNVTSPIFSTITALTA